MPLCLYAIAFAFAFGSVVDLHRVCLFRVISEVIRHPTLVRVQVRWDDRSQLGFQTVGNAPIGCLGVLVGASGSTTLIFTSSSSFDTARFS